MLMTRKKLAGREERGSEGINGNFPPISEVSSDSVLPTWIYPSRPLVYLPLLLPKIAIFIEHHLWFGNLLGT